jgi:ferric iron reductase protein FhuF
MIYILTLFINKHFYFMRNTFTAVALMCSLGLWASRVTQNFDFGWKFVNKDEAVKQMYDDKAWQSVSLPHDWDFSILTLLTRHLVTMADIILVE